MTIIEMRERGAIRLNWKHRDVYAIPSGKNAVSGADSYAIYTSISRYSAEFSYLMHEGPRFVALYSIELGECNCGVPNQVECAMHGPRE